ncbi:GNAT family N-acetyltransferase [Celerinatantimonas yamalensis]|uniref:GNAT family N-acetyltransferase n=1 Tax=Celerinatantimonas yamalensis TaxID=559956 RepID=A0ABW9G5R5_9GAMM
MVSLELATLEDAEILKLISMDAFSPDFEQYGSYPPGIESLTWHASEVEKGHYYKIVNNDKVAGGMLAVPAHDSDIEIKYFFIAKEFQNRQIGSTAMHLIEAKYPSMTVWNLVTPSKAYRNHHFYEKLGYLKIGESQLDLNKEFKFFEYQKTKQSNG